MESKETISVESDQKREGTDPEKAKHKDKDRKEDEAEADKDVLPGN